MPRHVASKSQPTDLPTALPEVTTGVLSSASSSEPPVYRAPTLRPKLAFPSPPSHPLSSQSRSNSSYKRSQESIPTDHDAANHSDEVQSPNETGHNGRNESERTQSKGRDEQEVLRASIEASNEEELSETQLRKLFEDEEIERFLRHFTAHVQEVRLSTAAPTATTANLLASESPDAVTVSDATEIIASLPTIEGLDAVNAISGEDEREGTELNTWTTPDQAHPHPLKDVDVTSGGPSKKPSLLNTEQFLSENVARNYLLPALPPVQPISDDRFTLGRARLQVERFILVAQPAYGPFFARLWGYASWKSRERSAYYCVIFWVLWYLDLLLPTFSAMMLYTLLKRRIFSYPTLEELRDRRREMAQAEMLGQEMERRFATGPEFGMRDAWAVFRSITNRNRKPHDKKAKSDKSAATEREDSHATPLSTMEDPENPMVEILGESQAEKDVKLGVLKAVSEIADLHERVKNIFLWRRPQTSNKYGMAIACIFLVTLLLPARYLAKLTYFVGGFFFWFVTPVILGLPVEDRSRLPPAFADSPTDAQYAMELIAVRVARGESVVPATVKSAKRKNSSAGGEGANTGNSQGVQDGNLEWRKWGERAARGMAWAEEGKRVFKRNKPLRPEPTWQDLGTSTYPAQYITGPGLITLSSTSLSFTQVLSSKPRMEIQFDQIHGVKKTGTLGGLTLKWGENEAQEREERFKWIGGRDEVFAKLIGRGRGRWMQV